MSDLDDEYKSLLTSLCQILGFIDYTDTNNKIYEYNLIFKNIPLLFIEYLDDINKYIKVKKQDISGLKKCINLLRKMLKKTEYKLLMNTKLVNYKKMKYYYISTINKTLLKKNKYEPKVVSFYW